MKRTRFHERYDICPPGAVGWFDNLLRPLVHSPARLFGPFVRPGMTVLDVGCGAGWATLGLARLVGPAGKVVAADLQDEMLDKTVARARRSGLADRLQRHRTGKDRIGATGPFDFGNAFWMVHETPDQTAFVQEIFDLLAPGGHFFIAEPMVHVSASAFAATLATATSIGFHIAARPRAFFTRAAVLQRPQP